jgi:hypothetical protein
MPRDAHMMPKETAPEPDGKMRSKRGVFRFSMAQLLVALVFVFVAIPFIEHVRGNDVLETVLLTIALLSAVPALGDRRRTMVWAVVLVIPAVAGKWLNHLRPDLVPAEVFLVAGMLFFLFVILHFLRFILRAPRVDSEILCAGAATYLMLGWLWALAYILVARLVPDSFVFTVGPASIRSLEGFRGLYFSYATLTTVGYGDIIPVSNGARMLAMTEAMAGMFYATLLIARLVALYYSKGTPKDSE